MNYIHSQDLDFELNKKLFPVNKEVIKKEFDNYLQNSNWDKKSSIDDHFRFIDYQLNNLGTLELIKQRNMPWLSIWNKIKFQEYLLQLQKYKNALIYKHNLEIEKKWSEESIKVLSFIDFIKTNITSIF